VNGQRIIVGTIGDRIFQDEICNKGLVFYLIFCAFRLHASVEHLHLWARDLKSTVANSSYRALETLKQRLFCDYLREVSPNFSCYYSNRLVDVVVGMCSTDFVPGVIVVSGGGVGVERSSCWPLNCALGCFWLVLCQVEQLCPGHTFVFPTHVVEGPAQVLLHLQGISFVDAVLCLRMNELRERNRFNSKIVSTGQTYVFPIFDESSMLLFGVFLGSRGRKLEHTSCNAANSCQHQSYQPALKPTHAVRESVYWKKWCLMLL
jgi:hypothetical protein